MNTGIGDAVDLGWKLAATLDGWGGPSLLNSYEHERRGVGLRNVGTTTEFHNEHLDFDGFFDVAAPTPAGERLREEIGAKLVSLIGRMFRTEGLQIGYRYDDSPICIPDGSPPAPLDPEVYCPTARPGARAPHT